MNDYLYDVVCELLHVEEGTTNKLIDLYARDLSKTYFLHNEDNPLLGEYVLSIIKERIGRAASTVLKNSSLDSSSEQLIGGNLNIFDWECANGAKDVSSLHAFIADIYKELSNKGNNPLFLSVGALKWTAPVGNSEGKPLVKEILTPLLIFPIKLIRGSSTTPVSIEFVNDDAYFNPCLIEKLNRVMLSDVGTNFPNPNGVNASFDLPLSLERMGNGNIYFNKVIEYVNSCKNKSDKDVVFDFDPNIVAISSYNHNEICMYYDIKRNKEKMLRNPLILRVFGQDKTPFERRQVVANSNFVLPYDSVQEKMINSAVSGESMVIKGPPGTGKTLTIANMISALLAADKKILVSSKKLAALSEVYAKVPDRLRKFLLLLDSESEQEAAKINPSTIKKDLSSLISERKTFSFNDRIFLDKQHAEKEKRDALLEISKHYKDVFADVNVLGGNYYEALDIYAKDENIPEYPFDPNISRGLSRDKYLKLYSVVSQMSNHYEVLTSNEEHSLYKNPWFGINPNANADEALRKYNEIVNNLEPNFNRFNDVLSKYHESVYNINVLDLVWLLQSNLTDEQVELTSVHPLLVDNSNTIRKLSKDLMNQADLLKEYGDSINKVAKDSLSRLAKLDSYNLPHSINEKDIQTIFNNLHLFENENSNFLSVESINNLLEIKKEHERLLKESESIMFDVTSTFDKDKVDEILKDIQKYHKSLSNYYEKDDDKPFFLDFGANGSYNTLKNYCYLSDVTFKDIVKAIRNLNDYSILQGNIKKLLNDVQRVFKCKMTDSEINSLFIILKYSSETPGGIKHLVDVIKNSSSDILRLADDVCLNKKWTIENVYEGYKIASDYQRLLNEVNKLETETLKFNIDSPSSLIKVSRGISSLGHIASVIDIDALGIDAYVELYKEFKEFNKNNDIISTFSKFSSDIAKFKNDCFENYYTIKQFVCSFDDIRIFIKEAKDSSMISDALRYMEFISTRYELPLDQFFNAFANESFNRNGYEFVTIFEHSVYGSAIKHKIAELGNRHFDVGKNMIANFKKFQEADERIRVCNESVIEHSLMKTIDPNDNDFDFLQNEKDSGTLRRLFKLYARELLKLKKCIILSPSTISLLFRNDEFSNFDIAIIDEASQLEPVTILPILNRCKQCIVVGDEWQMPPMVHFKSKFQKNIDDIEAQLEPDTSALSLILKNAAFNIHELECHYRSKTESLIKFSQKAFYPKMKTFPAPLPKKENLGYKDIYVEGATCSGGENLKEAEHVIDELKLHFKKYFVGDKLLESIGIVTFGEKQKTLIESLIRKDRAFDKMIQLAISNRDPGVVKDKVFFIKTIEEVQGQEANHLILSMTYGVDEKGRKVNRFGQLNRDRLGQCIFNVAVTRAQYSITLVHSVHAYELDDSERIGYLKNYIDIVETFAREDQSQFLGNELNDGFIKSVGKYLVSLGIDESRIVYDYGVTDGSIRIPIAILSKDLKRAVKGIFLEKDLKNSYNYLDYNVRYYDILKSQCSWDLERIFIHDWIDNKDYAQAILRNIAMQVINL